LFGDEQTPKVEQTFESEELSPKQTFSSQFVPVYPVEQLQEFGELQIPLDEQTFEFEEFKPKQIFNSHLLPV
jgi:hypothetical protein